MNTILSKNARKLLINDVMYIITAMFAETFLVAYFLKITNESLLQVSLYYILVYLVLGIGRNVIGKIIKKFPKHISKVMSLGIILRGLFILLISILGNSLADNFMIIAILFGIAEALYWSARELIFVEITTNHNRQNFVTKKKVLEMATNILLPILLGSTIDILSFSKIGIYIFLASIIQILVSFQIKPKDFVKPYENKKYNIKMLLKNENPLLKNYYKASFIFGLTENTIQVLVIIITVMTFKTSLNLGILTTIFALCSMVSVSIYGKYYNRINAKKYLWICSGLIIIGMIGLLFSINKISLIIYNFMYTISFCILDSVYNAQKGNLIRNCKIENYTIEFTSLVDTFLCFSRILGLCLILLAGLLNTIFAFKLVLLLTAISVLIYTRYITKTEN